MSLMAMTHLRCGYSSALHTSWKSIRNCGAGGNRAPLWAAIAWDATGNAGVDTGDMTMILFCWAAIVGCLRRQTAPVILAVVVLRATSLPKAEFIFFSRSAGGRQE